MKSGIQIKGIVILSACLIILAANVSLAAPPVLFFSDATDSPTTGWEQSSSKGAAVSIWGINFGPGRGSSYVTVGGVALTNDPDYAEWGETRNPTTARGLQRITFYLNSSMSTSPVAPNTTIKVTVAGVASNSIQFHCRALGTNKIYFISPTGNDRNSGLSASAPWKTGRKIRTTVKAGDAVYFRGGMYTTPDADIPSRLAFIRFSSGNYNSGGQWNTINLSSYPGEVAQIGNGELSLSMTRFLEVNGCAVAYWTFSKFYGLLHESMTAYVVGYETSHYNNIRFVGCELHTTFSTSGTGIAFTAGPSDGFRLLGNYFHNCGMGVPPDAPAVDSGAGTGLTGTYKAKVTFASTSSAGSRSTVYNETLPSGVSATQTLSNSSLRVSWSGVPTGSYNTVTVWRTRAGGSTFYLDRSIAVSSSSGSVDTTTPDGNLTPVLDPNGFNADYYRAGMPWYFGGYGTEDKIEIAFNEVAYCYSGGQIYGHTASDKVVRADIHSNYIHDTHRRAFNLGGGDGGTYYFVGDMYVYNNVISNCDYALKLNAGSGGDGGNYYIYNNTFFHNQKYSGDVDFWFIGASGTKIVFKNNITYSDPALSAGYVTYHQGSSTGCGGNNNLWYGHGNGPSWSSTGDVQNSDPLFIVVNPMSYSDFMLASNSPAINVGTNAVSAIVTKDILGVSRPQGDVFDIGAFEI